jgi:hypothetical protein
MTNRPIAAIVLLLLLAAPLLAAPLQAQEAQAPAAPDSANDTGNTTETAGDEPAPAERSESPFDYKSSEEISEDLSVSFPVDI